MSVFSTTSSSSAKFETPGQVVAGQITEIGEPFHATKFGSSEKDSWPSGDPKMKVSVTLKTQERDQADPNDEGLRSIYMTVSGTEGGQLWAIKQALRAANVKDLAVGGHLAVRFAGFDPESKNPQNPKKMYQAQYTPPAGGGAFSTEPAQQAPAPQQQYQQASPVPVAGVPGQAPAWATGGQAPQQQYQQPMQQQQAPQGDGNPWANQPPAQQAPAPQQQYQAPVQVNTQTGEILTPQPAQQAPQQGYQPTPAPQFPSPTPQQQAHQASVDVAQIQAMIGAGASEQQINAATGASFEQIAAIRNLG
ncbi:hypothetical protein [Glutamicibacter arilaitensis]|uniref:hypothetical protein n=1 Tax=Glutamicibacter arilaitensis TaxID=256701 RepID=UPI00384CA828